MVDLVLALAYNNVSGSLESFIVNWSYQRMLMLTTSKLECQMACCS